MTATGAGPRPPLLPDERAGTPAPAELAERRAAIAGALAAGHRRTDPAPREVEAGGRRALVFDPPGPALATVVHFHGGAFRLGCPDQVAPFARALADRCSVRVICPAYRLAPEHPYPAGLRDAWSVLESLPSQGAAPILSGDSAGGGVAAALAGLAVEAGIALAGLVLLSPWLDLTLTAQSYRANAAHDPVFSHAAAAEAAALYLQGHPPHDRSVSPLLGDVASYPPTLIVTGAGEVLADDSRRFGSRLRAAGVPCRLMLIDGMEHVAVTRSRGLAGADEAFDAVEAFVRSVADRPAAA